MANPARHRHSSARCEARLRALDLPAPLTLDALRAAVEAQRGRPVVLEPFPFAAHCSELSGLTIASHRVDLVFYERDTSRPHQWAIILHEFAHLLCGSLCGHPSAQVKDLELLREVVSAFFLPEDFQPEAVLSALSRTSYDSEREQEVELLASLLLPRLVATRPPATPASPEAREVLARLRAALEEQQATGARA